ncbi:MAG: fibrobacter succinogenes major paralogous domain-containing protein [Bacteroidota bacterium]
MKASALSGWISLLRGNSPDRIKYSLLYASHFLVAGILSVIFIGCEKEVTQPKFDTDLLTSTVWGEENICGSISNPEIYMHIFEPGGRYLRYYKIYQELYGAKWSLKDNETLILIDYEYKILTLNENMLEIRRGLCTSRFQALSQSKATTIGVTALSGTSARLHGFIRTSALTDVTFEYGTTTAYGAVLIPVNNPLSGPSNNIVHVTLSGLHPETVYHYRIKAVNTSGTNYGLDRTFRTFNAMTLTDADNNIYNTVTIGSQIWTTENLKTTKYNDGSAIPMVRDSVAWSNLSTPGYCWYNNDSLANMSSCGALYNWYTVNTGKLCPTGWHVPNDQEWTTLEQYLGQEAGSKLTEGGYDMNDSIIYSYPESNEEASNESGFSAVYAGMRTEASYFITDFCRLWSHTEDNFQSAWQVRINNGYTGLFSEDKRYGVAVRCLKD